MPLLLCLSWLFAVPYWESQPATGWSEEQLIDLLSNSPWAQSAPDSGKMRGPAVVIYLAAATPMLAAEEELLRRRFNQKSTAYGAIAEAREEYKAYLEEHAGKIIVVAIPLNPHALADAEETRRMKDESVLRVGKRKLKSTGHFPPTPNDPVLRLIFPREIPENAKDLTVEVYLPAITGPYRSAQFRLRDLVYRGVPDL